MVWRGKTSLTLEAKKRRISAVVADDSRAFRTAFVEFLKAHAVSVVGQAASGEAAVEAALGLLPDVIFIDARMPGIGGIEASRRIHACCPDTRVVIISANLGELSEDADRGCAWVVMTKFEVIQPVQLLALLNRLGQSWPPRRSLPRRWARRGSRSAALGAAEVSESRTSLGSREQRIPFRE